MSPGLAVVGVGVGVGLGFGLGLGPRPEDCWNEPLPQEAARKIRERRKSGARYFMCRIDAGFFPQEVCHSRAELDFF